MIFSSDKDYVNLPPKVTKKFETKVMIYKDLVDDLISWWVKDKDGRLIQVNTKDDESEVSHFD